MRVARLGPQTELSPVDPREIQQIVDQPGLQRDIALHHRHLPANLHRQPLIVSQRGGAEQHGRERCAQFVGKRRDEIVFRPQRRLRRLLGVAQSFLRRPSFGNVPQKTDEQQVSRAGHWIDAQLDGKGRAIAAHRRQFQAFAKDRTLAAGLQVRHPAVMRGAQLLGNDALRQGLPDHFVPPPAEDLLRGRVPVDNEARVVHQQNGVQRRVHDGPAALLTLVQRLVGGARPGFLPAHRPAGNEEQTEDQQQPAIQHHRRVFPRNHQPGGSSTPDAPAQREQQHRRAGQRPAQQNSIRAGRENAPHQGALRPSSERAQRKDEQRRRGVQQNIRRAQDPGELGETEKVAHQPERDWQRRQQRKDWGNPETALSPAARSSRAPAAPGRERSATKPHSGSCAPDAGPWHFPSPRAS